MKLANGRFEIGAIPLVGKPHLRFSPEFSPVQIRGQQTRHQAGPRFCGTAPSGRIPDIPIVLPFIAVRPPPQQQRQWPDFCATSVSMGHHQMVRPSSSPKANNLRTAAGA